MSAQEIRPDSALADLDIGAVLIAGLRGPGAARRQMFADAAVAAALRADALGVDPYGIVFLAQYVRSAGCAAAAALPEPLVGDRPTQLAGSWLRATVTEVSTDYGTGQTRLDTDELFARWLTNVAAILDLRRRAVVRP